jgi:hypothetical protein
MTSTEVGGFRVIRPWARPILQRKAVRTTFTRRTCEYWRRRTVEGSSTNDPSWADYVDVGPAAG